MQSQGERNMLRKLSYFILVSFVLATTLAQANPAGGQVISGDITINPTDAAGTMVIDQHSQQGIVNWDSFNIGAKETTIIHQPNADSTHLSRVVGSDPSEILGTLSSNGKVFLVNPNGILFAKGAKLDMPALVASTLNIKDQNFKSKNYDFNAALNPNGKAGSIINAGSLTASNGLIALLAPQIKNQGIINADLGQVHLGAGDHIVLNIGNNPLLNYELSDSMQVMNEQGTPVSIDNAGIIKANGGHVYLTAAAAHDVLHQVVSNSGVIEANRMGDKNGSIVLYANGGDVEVDGSLFASNGKIAVLGKNIHLKNNAQLSVSGDQAGSIYVGGPAEGKGDLAKAETSTIAQGARLSADSTGSNQDGGHIVVWSNDYTQALGRFSAQSVSGDGGLIETSGLRSLDVMGAQINTSSQRAGHSGTWLLDPYDITINAALAKQIVNTLATSNVLVTTTAGNSGSTGDLTVASAINYNSADNPNNNNLTLRAERDILVNSAITNNSTSGNLYLQATRNIEMNSGGSITSNTTGIVSLRSDYTATGTGAVNFNGSGTQITKTNGRVEIYYDPTGAGKYTGAQASTVAADFFASRVSLSSAALDSYMLINNTSDLTAAAAAVNDSDAYDSKFAFGQNIDLTGYAATPIGNFGDGNVDYYSGHFNGQNYVISNLTISAVGVDYQGLFGDIQTGADLRNLALTNVSITGAGAVGGLVGQMDGGNITNSYTTGTISSTTSGGGLLGVMGDGTISRSYSSAAVSGGESATVGGFVGLVAGASTISGSYATGAVTGGDSANVGGFVGQMGNGTDSTAAVSASYASGAVVAGGTSNAGGFIGYLLDDATISDAYSTGTVSSTGDNQGGFVGAMEGNASISNSYTISIIDRLATNSGGFAGSIAGAASIGGSFWNTQRYVSAPSCLGSGDNCSGVSNSTTAAMQTASTFTEAGWSTSIWTLVNGSYPTLVNVGLTSGNSNATTTLRPIADGAITSIVVDALLTNLSTSLVLLGLLDQESPLSFLDEKNT